MYIVGSLSLILCSSGFFQPYQKLAMLFYQGYCDWCSAAFEHAQGRVAECLQSISPNTDQVKYNSCAAVYCTYVIGSI